MSVKGQGHSLTLIKVTQASKLNLFPQKVMGHLNTNFMLQLLGAVEQNNYTNVYGRHAHMVKTCHLLGTNEAMILNLVCSTGHLSTTKIIQMVTFD